MSIVRVSVVSDLFRLAAVLLPAAMIIGCAGESRNRGSGADGGGDPASDAPPGAEGGGGGRKVVMFLGTSLTAGYGVEPEEAYPTLIQARIDSAGLPWEVVNAGLSGETSAGARGRIRWLLEQPFDALVLETGANDMLRGADLDTLRANLQFIVDTVKRERPGVPIVLAGMLAPPNLGAAYGRELAALYPEVARRNGLPLIPFLLEGVGGVDSLNQQDAIHPNPAGQRRVAETVWRTLEPVLRVAGGGAASPGR